MKTFGYITYDDSQPPKLYRVEKTFTLPMSGEKLIVLVEALNPKQKVIEYEEFFWPMAEV